MSLRLIFKAEKYRDLIMSSIDYFKDMESKSLINIDIEKCIESYSGYLLICHDLVICEEIK